jgi:DNA-binding response OmpR family regulator
VARILLVEDETRISQFIERSLRARNYIVESVFTGSDGLSRALADSYDLVILDLMLPGMNGSDVLRELLAQRPEQRVLVLSAMADVTMRVQMLDMGAQDFLAKPFAVSELIARVRARLRSERVLEPPQGEQWLNVGDLRLDLTRHTLEASGRNIELTDREFRLLLHLMRRANQVCSREELLADVWGYTFDPGSNVVDVYVRRLRRKLNGEMIETVRNVGYCLAS